MLEAKDITFGYDAARPLYRGFSLRVEAGERVALQAPSGFGKTTLCRILAGYERPAAGQVLVDGRPLPRRGVCPVQLIQQHPEQAVDPRLRMRKTLAEAGEVPQQLLDDLGIREEWLQRVHHAGRGNAGAHLARAAGLRRARARRHAAGLAHPRAHQPHSHPNARPHESSVPLAAPVFVAKTHLRCPSLRIFCLS